MLATSLTGAFAACIGPQDCVRCRRSVNIIIAYIASTLLVMLWLTYTIHVTLTENEEDAQSIRQGPRVSEFLKACARSYPDLLQLVFVVRCHAVVGPAKSYLLLKHMHTCHRINTCR